MLHYTILNHLKPGCVSDFDLLQMDNGHLHSKLEGSDLLFALKTADASALTRSKHNVQGHFLLHDSNHPPMLCCEEFIGKSTTPLFDFCAVSNVMQPVTNRVLLLNLHEKTLYILESLSVIRHFSSVF